MGSTLCMKISNFLWTIESLLPVDLAQSFFTTMSDFPDYTRHRKAGAAIGHSMLRCTPTVHARVSMRVRLTQWAENLKTQNEKQQKAKRSKSLLGAV